MLNEPELKKKNIFNRILSNQLFVTLITTFFMIFIIAGSSYAIFSENNETSNESDVIVQSGDLEVVISSDSEAIIKDYAELGVTDEVGMTYEPYTFLVENTGEHDVIYYEIRLVDREYSNSTMPHKALNFAISKDGGDYTSPINLGDNASYIYTGGPLAVGEGHNFSLKLWVAEEFGELARDKVLNVSLEITLYSEMPSRNYIIYDLNGGYGIVPKTNVSTRKITSVVPKRDGYGFSGWSIEKESEIVDYQSGDTYNEDTGKILYAVWQPTIVEKIKEIVSTSSCNSAIVENNITYLSGTNDCVDFNYVWYSGKLWRITAVYPDGSMKMVTDDIMTVISYGADSTFATSYIKDWLNQEFLPTLYNYEKMIKTNYQWNATQTTNFTSSLAETTMVGSTVGLLNSYEYYKSYQNANTGTGYLNISNYWWLINPNSSTNVWYVSNSGSASKIDVSSISNKIQISYGVRPSVVLLPGVKIKSGIGKINNPYLLEGDIKDSSDNKTLLNSRVSGEYVKIENDKDTTRMFRIVGTETIGGNLTTKLVLTDNVKIKSDGTNLIKRFSKVTSYDYTLYGNGEGSEATDYYLNNEWINSLDTNSLVQGTYYLGTYNTLGYKGTVCSKIGSTSISECINSGNVVTDIWTGYVGLLRVGEMFSSPTSGEYFTISLTELPENYSETIDVAKIVGGEIESTFASCHDLISGVRPTINLNSNMIIKSGSGTETDPFIISIETYEIADSENADNGGSTSTSGCGGNTPI